MKPAESSSVLSSQGVKTCFFILSEGHSRTLLQAILALSLVIFSLKSLCCDFPVFKNQESCFLRHSVYVFGVTDPWRSADILMWWQVVGPLWCLDAASVAMTQQIIQSLRSHWMTNGLCLVNFGCFVTIALLAQWRSSKALDLWSIGHGFNTHQDKAA